MKSSTATYDAGTLISTDRPSVDTIPVVQLLPLLESYVLDGAYQLKSDRYMQEQRALIERRFLPFLTSIEATHIGKMELRQFLIHTRQGGCNDKGKTTSESTVANYYRSLRAFWSWIVTEGVIDRSPFVGMPPPKVPKKKITPFTQEQIQKLLLAATNTRSPRRDVAILLMLLDTGMRVGELVSLTIADVDLTHRKATVKGKGGKIRDVYWSPITGRALIAYLRERTIETSPHETDPLWIAACGRNSGAALTQWGVRQIMERLEEATGITGVRCSPHTMRHTFALEFLGEGGDVFSLMRILGHEDLATTKRYINASGAALQAAHTRSSPVMSMMKKK